MKKRALSVAEMNELLTLMRRAFTYVDDLRRCSPLAHWIQYPKTPSILSESLVLHLINQGQIVESVPGDHARLGGKIADILVRGNGVPERKVEVKASAGEGFSEFVEKDTLCDVLIWVHFGQCFTCDQEGAIEVHVVDHPSRFFPKRQKINLGNFMAKVCDQSRRIIVPTPIASAETVCY